MFCFYLQLFRSLNLLPCTHRGHTNSPVGPWINWWWISTVSLVCTLGPWSFAMAIPFGLKASDLFYLWKREVVYLTSFLFLFLYALCYPMICDILCLAHCVWPITLPCILLHLTSSLCFIWKDPDHPAANIPLCQGSGLLLLTFCPSVGLDMPGYRPPTALGKESLPLSLPKHTMKLSRMGFGSEGIPSSVQIPVALLCWTDSSINEPLALASRHLSLRVSALFMLWAHTGRLH